MTLFGFFERIRAMTQGEWNLPDDYNINMLLIVLFGKYNGSERAADAKRKRF